MFQSHTKAYKITDYHNHHLLFLFYTNYFKKIFKRILIFRNHYHYIHIVRNLPDHNNTKCISLFSYILCIIRQDNRHQ